MPFETTPENILLAGRIVSFATSFALSLLLGFWARRNSATVPVVILAALLPFFFHDIALTQFFRLRPESAATFFSVAAIVVLLKPAIWTKRVAIAAALCVCAFLFKQSFIVAPVAIAVHFMIRRDWPKLACFVAVYGGLAAAFLTVMYTTYGAAYFENTVVSMAANEVRPWEAITIYSEYFIGNSYGLLLAVPAALFIAWRMREDGALLMWYWIAALLWNIYSSGKLGSSANYYAEFASASILLVVFALATRQDQSEPLLKKLPVLFVLAPLFAQVVVGAFQGFAHHKPVVFRDDSGVDLAPYLARYRTNEGKLIFHEKIAIQLGHPVGYDWFLTDVLIRQGRYEPDTLIQRIHAGAFDTIVFSQKPYSYFEREVYKIVSSGPFRREYVDQTVIEWRRVQ